MNNHWTSAYVGKPWEVLGRGPSSFDCWGLVRHVYEIELGISLPLFLIDPHDSVRVAKQIKALKKEWLTDWTEVTKPKEYDLVLLGRTDQFHHVGLWTSSDRGFVVHACDGSFVVAQSLSTLRRTGWHKIAFYTYKKP